MLLGNNNIVSNQTLRRRLYDDITAGTLVHSYIIEGRYGSGRHTIAKNIIAALACTGEKNELPCGECKNCRDVFEEKCPDVMTIGRDGKASLGVESIRNLKSTLLAVPNNLEIKAYILEDADTMTVQAQNAFLLTLEEPPKNVYFFLLCENSRSLLETIRSRAAILRTDKVSSELIKEYICSKKVPKSVSDAAKAIKNNDPQELDTILLSADGSIGRAMELLSPKARAPIIALRNVAEKFITSVKSSSKSAHPLMLLPLFSQKRDELSNQLEYIKGALRDLIVLKKCETAPLCFFTDREKAFEISDLFSERLLLSIFNRVNDASDAILRNANVRLTLIDMLSRL